MKITGRSKTTIIKTTGKYEPDFWPRALRGACLFIVFFLAPGTAFADKVEILRDTYGIPHVFADSVNGAYYGDGWSFAEDEGFTFLTEILAARGQTSAFLQNDSRALDEALVKRDLESKAFQYYELASDWEQMQSDVKMALGAFADGFNDYMDQILNNEHLRNRFGTYNGIATAEIIEKAGHITVRDLVALAIGLNVLDALGNLSDVELNIVNEKTDNSGSNAAAIGADLNEYKKPMLYGDIHNEFTNSQHIAQLSAPGLSIFAYFKGPFPISGRGNDIAIAFTRNFPDGIDIYLEEIDPERPDYYRVDNEWMKMEQKQAAIKVRGHEDIVVPFYYTRHGLLLDYRPVKNPKSNFVYAIRVAVLERTGDTDAPYKHAAQRMRIFWSDSIGTFYNIARQPYSAQKSFVLADNRFNIAYLWYGRIPIRITDINPNYSIRYDKPLDGWNSLNNWIGGYWMIGDPDFQLPFYLNPLGGNVRSANDAPWYSNGCDQSLQKRPYWIPNHVVPDWVDTTTRGNILRNVLCSRKVRTFQDVHDQLAFSTYCPTADAFIQAIQNGWKANENALKQREIPDSVRELDSILQNWDARADVDQAGMTVMFHLRRITALPRFSETYTPTLVEMNAYLNDLKTVSETMMDLYGKLNVPWGEIHIMQFGGREFPLPGGTSNIQSLFLSTKEFVLIHGKSGKPDMMYGDKPDETDPRYRGKIICTYGSSFIHAHLMDKQNPVTYMITPHGQMDPEYFPESKHLFQQAELYADKQWIRMPMTREEVEKALCPWGDEPGHEHPAITKLEYSGPSASPKREH